MSDAADGMAYPDEELPQNTIGFTQFNRIALRLFRRTGLVDDTVVTGTSSANRWAALIEFVDFVLAGRYSHSSGSQRFPYRLYVNPRLQLPDMAPLVEDEPNDDSYTITRDYDSLIGVSKTLPYHLPISVYPVPPKSEHVRKSKESYTCVGPNVRTRSFLLLPSLIRISGNTGKAVAGRHPPPRICQGSAAWKVLRLLSRSL